MFIYIIHTYNYSYIYIYVHVRVTFPLIRDGKPCLRLGMPSMLSLAIEKFLIACALETHYIYINNIGVSETEAWFYTWIYIYMYMYMYMCIYIYMYICVYI